MSSPDNLDLLLNLAIISESVLLSLLGQCGVSAPAGKVPALPSHHCVQLLAPLTLWSSQLSLYPEKSIQSTVTTVASADDLVQTRGKLKIAMLLFKDPLNNKISICSA